MNINYNKFLLLITIITLCISCVEDGVYDFKDSKDAIISYRNYLHEIRDTKTSNTEDFISELRKWHEVNDTVWKFLKKQQDFNKSHSTCDEFVDIHDSIRHQMLRLTETWRYDYDDILSIKQKSSMFCEDSDLRSAVDEASPFFLSLDSVPLMAVDKVSFLKQYRTFLQEQTNRMFQSKEDVKTFIRREDRFFRMFLLYINDMEGEYLTDITRNTETICRNIFLAAREGRLSARDVMVYMSMRTTRRLLQNSMTCVDGISKHEVKSKSQANAYLWMIIQPFISIDQFAIATLTHQEKSDFGHIAKCLLKSRDFANLFGIEQQSLNYLLPQQLLKLYILSL